MNIDVKFDINNWGDQFDGQVKITVDSLEDTLYQAALEFLKIVKERTPIRNVALWKKKPSRRRQFETPGALRDSWEIERRVEEIIIQNLRPYAWRVEHGWSYKQAPQGMLRITLIEFPDILNRIANKTYRK